MAADWQYADNGLSATSTGVSVSFGLKADYLRIAVTTTSAGFCVEFDGATATTSASYEVLSTSPLVLEKIPISSFVGRATTATATVRILAIGQAISS